MSSHRSHFQVATYCAHRYISRKPDQPMCKPISSNFFISCRCILLCSIQHQLFFKVKSSELFSFPNTMFCRTPAATLPSLLVIVVYSVSQLATGFPMGPFDEPPFADQPPWAGLSVIEDEGPFEAAELPESNGLDQQTLQKATVNGSASASISDGK